MPRTPAQAATIKDPTAATSAVEIKVTIRAEQEMKAIRLFDLDRANAESRQVYFLDTRDLTCFKGGVVLRARLVKNGADDSTVKIRPVDPKKVAPSWKKLPGFKLEADIVGASVVRSASLSHPQKRGEITDVAVGTRAIEKLFSPDQERFLGEHAPSRVPFDRLKLLGPIDVLRWKSRHDEIPSDLTAEEWHLPDGTDLLELSIKVDRKSGFSARDAFVTFLTESGIDHSGAQEAKTRIALECLVRRLPR